MPVIVPPPLLDGALGCSNNEWEGTSPQRQQGRVMPLLALRARHRGPTMRDPVDHKRIQAAVREILLAVGEDPERDGLRDTPARVARMYAELFSGLHMDASEVLGRTFPQKYDEMVLVKNI